MLSDFFLQHFLAFIAGNGRHAFLEEAGTGLGFVQSFFCYDSAYDLIEQTHCNLQEMKERPS